MNDEGLYVLVVGAAAAFVVFLLKRAQPLIGKVMDAYGALFVARINAKRDAIVKQEPTIPRKELRKKLGQTMTGLATPSKQLDDAADGVAE
jgi:hypothetical protein